MSRPDSIGVALPEPWVRMPLAADEFERYLARVIDEDGNGDHAMARQVELALRQLRAAALQRNAVIVSSLVAAVDGDELVTAGLVISTLTREELGTAIPLRPEVLVAASSAAQEASSVDGWRLDDIEPAQLSEGIGGTQSVKLVQLLSSERIGQELKAFAQTYLIPDRLGDNLVVAQFLTPNTGLARELSELFAAIARTIKLMYPGEPTFEDDPGPEGGDG